MTCIILFTDPDFVNLNLFQELWTPWILKQITKDSVYRMEEVFFVEIIHTHGHKMLWVLVFEKGVSGKRKRKRRRLKIPKNIIHKEMSKESHIHKIEIDGGVDKVIQKGFFFLEAAGNRTIWSSWEVLQTISQEKTSGNKNRTKHQVSCKKRTMYLAKVWRRSNMATQSVTVI